MLQREAFVSKIDTHKPIILGLFLGSQILGHAIGNIALFLLLSLFFFTIIVKKKVSIDKLLFPIIFYFLWGVISVFWTTSVSDTLSGVGKTIGLLIIPLFLSQQSRVTNKDIKKIFDIFSYCLVIYFLIVLVRACLFYFYEYDTSHFFYHNLVSLFKNNAIYISLFVGICLLVKINCSDKNNLDRVTILLLSGFLILLASKNLIISTGVLVIFSKILMGLKKDVLLKNSIVPILITTGFVFTLVFFENPIKQRFLEETSLNIDSVLRQDDFSNFVFNGSSLRIFQWRIVHEMIENDQLGFLGLGLNNVNYLTEQYFNYYNVYQGYMPVNFHNQYLQTFGELGVIGCLLLFSIFLFLFRKSFTNKNVIILVICLLIAFSFFTESYLSRQKGILLFATCYSLFIRYSNGLKIK